MKTGAPIFPCSTAAFDRRDLGHEAFLEEHADFRLRPIGFGDQRVDLLRGGIERLFDEDVQPAPDGGDRLLGMEAGGAADGDEIHRVREEGFEVVVRHGAGHSGQRRCLFAITAVHGDDLTPRRCHARPERACR